jgi:hypothetical protein
MKAYEVLSIIPGPFIRRYPVWFFHSGGSRCFRCRLCHYHRNIVL